MLINLMFCYRIHKTIKLCFIRWLNTTHLITLRASRAKWCLDGETPIHPSTHPPTIPPSHIKHTTALGRHCCWQRRYWESVCEVITVNFYMKEQYYYSSISYLCGKEPEWINVHQNRLSWRKEECPAQSTTTLINKLCWVVFLVVRFDPNVYQPIDFLWLFWLD